MNQQVDHFCNQCEYHPLFELFMNFDKRIRCNDTVIYFNKNGYIIADFLLTHDHMSNRYRAMFNPDEPVYLELLAKSKQSILCKNKNGDKLEIQRKKLRQKNSILATQLLALNCIFDSYLDDQLTNEFTFNLFFELLDQSYEPGLFKQVFDRVNDFYYSRLKKLFRDIEKLEVAD